MKYPFYSFGKNIIHIVSKTYHMTTTYLSDKTIWILSQVNFLNSVNRTKCKNWWVFQNIKAAIIVLKSFNSCIRKTIKNSDYSPICAELLHLTLLNCNKSQTALHCPDETWHSHLLLCCTTLDWCVYGFAIKNDVLVFLLYEDEK